MYKQHLRLSGMCMIVWVFASFVSHHSPAWADKTGGMIFGTITDRASNSPLIGASVRIENTNMGGMANEKGEYTLKQVPPGTYNLRFMMIGYQPLVKTNVVVSPDRGTEISVGLALSAVEVEGVTVKAQESYFEKDPEAEVSGKTMDTQEIIDAAGGTLDVQRVIQVMPSVSSGIDQINEIVVRGGNFNENLTVMDGIEIPNINHFSNQSLGGGPISMVRSEFINDVSFMAGAFPARFGDKASSVLDISLRKGSRERMLKSVDLGIAGFGAMAEGPAGDNGSYLVSGRVSYLDLIASNWETESIPHYYNMQSKVSWDFGIHTVMWNTLFGADHIKGDNAKDSDMYSDEFTYWTQKSDLFVTGLTVKSALSRSLYGQLVVSHVQNNWNNRDWLHEKNGLLTDSNESTESENTLKYDLSWFWRKQEISGGFSLKNCRFNDDMYQKPDTVYVYDWTDSAADPRYDFKIRNSAGDADSIYTINPELHGKEHVDTYKTAAYGQVRLVPVERLTLRLGGRYDKFIYTKDSSFSPRAGVRYQVTDNFFLNGAYGKHYQSPAYVMLIASSNNRNLKNYHTEQFVAGTEWFPFPEMRITLEAYSKKYRDIPVLKALTNDNPFDDPSDMIDYGDMVNKGKGHSEGIELFLHRKMTTSYMYLISYSLYRCRFDDPRTGEERPGMFDLKNIVTLTGSKQWNLMKAKWYTDGMRPKLWYKTLAWLLPFGDEVTLSAKWRYSGGRPYTEPVYVRQYHEWIVPTDEKIYDTRLGDYQRLDIRIDRRYFFNDWSLVVYFDFWNVFNRKNIFDYNRSEYGEKEQINNFEAMPMLGFNFEF
ncbi:TonB-dependent receptor [bacterium]|nr:TonB-dependent receptor [bacterium]